MVGSNSFCVCKVSMCYDLFWSVTGATHKCKRVTHTVNWPHTVPHNHFTWTSMICVNMNGVRYLNWNILAKGVTLEVNLREHISCMPPPSVNNSALSGFETKGDITRNPKPGYFAKVMFLHVSVYPQRVSRPISRRRLGGLAGGLKAHTQGGAWASGWGGVSRSIPRGEVGGSGQGISRPISRGSLGVWLWGSPSPGPGGVQAQPGGNGVSRPRPGMCIPACTEADTHSGVQPKF